MNYRFGIARRLYKNRSHPRVMLGPQDLIRLRQQVQAGDGRKIMMALRKKVKRLVAFVLESDDLVTLLKGDQSHNCPAAQLWYGIDDLAMVAALDEDQHSLEAIRRLFAVVTSPTRKRLRLSVGGLAIAYDMVHEHLSPSERRGYRRAA